MPKLQVLYGEQEKNLEVETGALLGDAIAQSEFSFEQPCAGRGTCGKCKLLQEFGLNDPDELEQKFLSAGELAVGSRLACRARIIADAQVLLVPAVVYSAKSFKGNNHYKTQRSAPLGLAIDLGSTTVAAFLTILDSGEVCAGAASLNQQVVYGADVISRLAAAQKSPETAERLHRLTVTSINQAVNALDFAASVRRRIERVTLVCNPAMHHFLARLPVHSLALMPFQPYQTQPIWDANSLLDGIFPPEVDVRIPPLIGGYVGADALACMVYFNFDRIREPTLVVDLGTNGEVLLTDGSEIVATSTAAGPAFEGGNISSGSRAVDGAVTRVHWVDGDFAYDVLGDGEPVGLTGSGLISAICTLRRVGAIEPNGRLNPSSQLVRTDTQARRMIPLTENIRISQADVRELQKAKAAIRAAIDNLLAKLSLQPQDLQRVILTGSFGGQLEWQDALDLGLLPAVLPTVIETIPNGAGLGAAVLLSDAGFTRGIELAYRTQTVSLDTSQDFMQRFLSAMAL